MLGRPMADVLLISLIYPLGLPRPLQMALGGVVLLLNSIGYGALCGNDQVTGRTAHRPFRRGFDRLAVNRYPSFFSIIPGRA